MLDGCDEGAELVDGAPNCPNAGMDPARRTSNSPPVICAGHAHTPDLDRLSKNPHMIFANLDA
jgi:hypothetical protein